MPPLRERLEVLRLAVEREGALRDAFAAPDAGFAAGLRAAVERLADLLAGLARAEVFRVPVDLRAELFRVAPLDDEPDEAPELALASPSIDHLPDITRCAASATASAMIDPSLVALDIILLAACEALSAASSPASRIARRAFGLALIAAAAAASPAASISLLIAALASLSTVVSPLFEEGPEELLRVDFAMLHLPALGKDTSSP